MRRRKRRQRTKAWSPNLGMWQGYALSAPYIVLVLLFVLYPFVRLLMIATEGPRGLSNFVDYFQNESSLRVLRTTFSVAAAVTLLSVLLGSLIAWSIKTTRSRWMRSALFAAVLLPFWMGSVVKLYAWTVMLQSFGVVNRFLMWSGLTDRPVSLLYNELAVVVGMTYQMLPYSVLPLAVAFATIDLDLIRAAESLGASRLRAIWTIVVPLSVPGVLATVTLVYVVCIGFFLTPVVLGGIGAPFSSSLISQDIFEFYDLTSAAVTSVVLLSGGLLVILAGYLLVGKDRLRKAMG